MALDWSLIKSKILIILGLSFLSYKMKELPFIFREEVEEPIKLIWGVFFQLHVRSILSLTPACQMFCEKSFQITFFNTIK